MAFTLGNLTASNDRNRELVGIEFNGVPMLVRHLEQVGSRYLRSAGDGASAAGSAGLEEVLVKLIRLLANISINPDVGTQVVATSGVQTLIALLSHSMGADREELLLNVVSAITNLSFYVLQQHRGTAADEAKGLDDPEPLSFIFAGHQEICTDLVGVLVHENEEAVAEAARAFGNFSRDPQVRQFMGSSRSDEALVLLLDHASREVVFSAVGALVNIAADPATKRVLVKPDLLGHAKLVSVLRRAGLSDAELSAVACKALHNLLLDTRVGGAESALGPATFGLLHRTLDELLDAAADAAADAADEAEAKGAEDPSDASLREFLSAARALQSILDEARGQEWEDLEEPR